MESIDSFIQESLEGSVIRLFQGYGIEMTPQPVNEPCFNTVAVVGFSGEQIQGALGIASVPDLIKATYSNSNGFIQDDWFAEIANQVLGRFKNSFVSRGIDMQLAIPMVMHGVAIYVDDKHEKVFKKQFYSEFGPACVWVDAEWESNLILDEVTEDKQAKEEGELILF